MTTSRRRQGRAARSSVSLLLALGREYAEDSVCPTLMPYPSMFAWRLTMLVFFDREEATGGVERLEVSVRQRAGRAHNFEHTFNQGTRNPFISHRLRQ